MALGSSRKGLGRSFWIVIAVGVVTVIPILIFSVFVQRYIVRGLTAGAVK